MEYLDRFLRLTRFNLRGVFEGFQAFTTQHYGAIQGYYLNNTSLPQLSFDAYFSLRSDIAIALDVFQQYRDSLRLDIYDDYLERIEDIDTYLRTVPLIPKLFRLSKDSMLDKYIVVNTSLEAFAQDNTADRENWHAIAIKNNLFETDYNRAGLTDGSGNELRVSRQQRRYNLFSVVDTIDSDSVLGADLPMSLRIDNGDYVVLSNGDTLAQTTNILASLLRNQNPTYNAIGIDKNMIAINRNNIFSSSIIRQITTNFRSDDSFRRVNVTNMTFRENALFIEVEVETIAGQIQQSNVNIAL